VNTVTSSTECPLTDKLDVFESPAPRFWIFVFCQDTCKPSFDAVFSKNIQSGMKVVYGVSQKGNVICVIQIREIIIAQ